MSDIIAMHKADLVNAITEAVKPIKAELDAIAAELAVERQQHNECCRDYVQAQARAAVLEADRDQISLTLAVAKADRDKWFNRAKVLEAELANERLTNKAWLRENAPGGWIDDLRVRMGRLEALLRRVAPTYGMSTLAQEIDSALETGTEP